MNISLQKLFESQLYKLKGHLKEDYSNLSKRNRKIFVCAFSINSNESSGASKYHLNNTKFDRFGKPKLPKFFLSYLLYKYQKKYDNKLVFPFSINDKNESPKAVADKLIKKFIPEKNASYPLGYIENSDGLFFFYNFAYTVDFSDAIYSSNQLWNCLIDEICNTRKVINFPIDETVTNIFYKNSFLIYLNYNDMNLPIPTVTYAGSSGKDLAINIAVKKLSHTGIGLSAKQFDYHSAFRDGVWNFTQIQKNLTDTMFTHDRLTDADIEHIKDTRNDIDSDGKYSSGYIIRSATFLGKKSWHIIDNRNDPFHELIQHWRLTNISRGEIYWKLKNTLAGWWPKHFDSITMGKIYIDSIGNVYPLYVPHILRKTSQYVTLSYHKIDTKDKDFPVFWDPNYNYNIV